MTAATWLSGAPGAPEAPEAPGAPDADAPGARESHVQDVWRPERGFQDNLGSLGEVLLRDLTVPAAAPRGPRVELGRYVLAVGGIEPRKGSIELLEAYAWLRRARPDVALVIAGGETLFDYRPYRARWEDRAVELDVEPVVLGPVPDPDLPSLVAAASAFAFPSVKEGFGLAAMEALAAGVPTVVSDLPVLREVFGDAAAFAAGPGALAAALADALDRPDPARRAAGRALAARYTWPAAARRHLKLYRSHVGAPAATDGTFCCPVPPG